MSQSFEPFASAALYSAFVVGIGMFFKYGAGFYGLGFIAGGAAFVATAAASLLFSPLFYLARISLPGLIYFLLHLSTGVAIGASLAARNPYVVEFHQYLFNNDGTIAICASMAAWIYVAVSVPSQGEAARRQTPVYREHGDKALVAGAIVLGLLIFLAPKQSDPSCHNVLRNGRLSADPSIRLRLKVDESELSTLADIYDTFAIDYGLSVRRPPRNPGFVGRSLCNEDVTIGAGDVLTDGKHSLMFYESEDGSGWESMASDLICRLEAVWDEDMIYTGGGGEEVSKPNIVAGECAN